MFNAEIYIALKKTVADPQGLTVKHALDSLGYNGVKEVRMGKLVRLSLDARDKAKAEEAVKEMCQKLLANPIIEEFTFKIEEAK
jgi:phosphoribosylformylglycinamidine synthase PurS subunit